MATQTPSLPRIDFSSENSEPGTSSWLSTSKQVKDALENHGFFLVTYDKISSEVKNAFILAMKEFHDLPEEQKSRFTSDKPYLGYFGQARDGKPPILELAAIGDPTSIQAVEGFTNLFRSSGKKDHLRYNLKLFFGMKYILLPCDLEIFHVISIISKVIYNHFHSLN